MQDQTRTSALRGSGLGAPDQSRIVTVPNAISVARLLLVPFFAVLIAQGRDLEAFAVLVLAGLSDWADGVIARRFNQTSSLGRMLDPAADRLFIAVALVGLGLRDVVPWWFVIVIGLREVSIATVLPSLLKRGYGPLPVQMAGKAGTAMLMYALPLLLLAELEGGLGSTAWAIGWASALWGAALYWLAGALYLVQAGTIIRSAPPVTPLTGRVA